MLIVAPSGSEKLYTPSSMWKLLSAFAIVTGSVPLDERIDSAVISASRPPVRNPIGDCPASSRTMMPRWTTAMCATTAIASVTMSSANGTIASTPASPNTAAISANTPITPYSITPQTTLNIASAPASAKS